MSPQNHEESVYGHDLHSLTISLYSVIGDFSWFWDYSRMWFSSKKKKSKKYIQSALNKWIAWATPTNLAQIWEIKVDIKPLAFIENFQNVRLSHVVCFILQEKCASWNMRTIEIHVPRRSDWNFDRFKSIKKSSCSSADQCDCHLWNRLSLAQACNVQSKQSQIWRDWKNWCC